MESSYLHFHKKIFIRINIGIYSKNVLGQDENESIHFVGFWFACRRTSIFSLLHIAQHHQLSICQDNISLILLVPNPPPLHVCVALQKLVYFVSFDVRLLRVVNFDSYTFMHVEDEHLVHLLFIGRIEFQQNNYNGAHLYYGFPFQ